MRFDSLALWPTSWTAWGAVTGEPHVFAGCVKREDKEWFRETCKDAIRGGDRIIVASPFERGPNR